VELLRTIVRGEVGPATGRMHEVDTEKIRLVGVVAAEENLQRRQLLKAQLAVAVDVYKLGTIAHLMF